LWIVDGFSCGRAGHFRLNIYHEATTGQSIFGPCGILNLAIKPNEPLLLL
jgi:hypothetical protein